MSALRAILSHLRHGDHDGASRPAQGRRAGSDRRQSERRSNVYPLQDKDTRLRFAARAAGFGIYDLDCETGDMYWSPELKAMAGLPPDNSPLSREEVERLVHPDDRRRFVERIEASLEPGPRTGLDVEFRLLRADGSVRWVKATGTTFFVGEAEDRHPLMATGIVMDITAAHQAELEILQSRAELVGLIDSVIDGIISIDAEQRIVLFNPAACRIFRCPVDEAIGSPLERFIPERARAAHREHVRRFAENGVTARTMGQPGVFCGLRTDGEEFPIEASISKVQVGGQWRMTVFVRDITERKAAEEALHHSQQELELALHGAAMGTWTLDLRTGVLVCSERFRELFGIAPGEPVNYERVLAALHPNDRERTVAAKTRAMENRDEYNIEHRVVWPDGSVHWLASVGRAFYNHSGAAESMSGVVQDITQRKQWEAELVHMNEQLESRIKERTAELVEANEALVRSNLDLQQFAYVAAHDLQTPLRSVIGFAQLFHKEYRGRMDKQADTWLDQLLKSAQRMFELIQDLLAYSRVDSQGGAFRPTDMRRLFDDVLSALDAVVRENRATVTCDDLPVVLGDRTQLAQVLQNLIGNSLKYHGGVPPRVHVSAERQGDEWVFAVCDNGIGIAEKHRERIFEIFYRLHTQQEYPGTGIGLAVCRRVIHRHGGRIWVDSQPGKGSTFYFTLPDRGGEGQ